jgi:hypothetical protein
MLDKNIEEYLDIIKEKRTPIHILCRSRLDSEVNRKDHAWCTASNSLRDALHHHRPALRMLEFGQSSLSRPTKLSWNKRISWLKRYCERYDVEKAHGRWHEEHQNI